MVEIQENVPVDEPVVAACEQLRMDSYEIALDNVTPGDAREKLIPFANYLKIDIRRVSEQHCAVPGRETWRKLHDDRPEGRDATAVYCRVKRRAARCFRGTSSGIPNACGPATFLPTKPASCGC